ncbi:MAG: type II secretion system F family protein [Planctomycetota bacterium]
MTMTLLALGSSLQGVALVLLPLAGSILLAYGLAHAAFDLRAAQRKKVVDRLRGGARTRSAEERLTLEAFRRQSTVAKGLVGRALNDLSVTRRLQRMIEQANLPWSAARVLVNLSAAAGALFAILLVVGVSPLIAAGTGAAVFILPILYMARRRKRRLKRLVEQLPDVFELLSQALRAGNALGSAMHLIATELPDPAGTEFGRVFHEQNLGLKVEDALRNLAERVDVLDVRFFVTAVLIQRQIGGDLAEVLDKISAVIRERIQLFGTVQALTAEGRLSGIVLLALPVLVFAALLFLNPDYVNILLTDPTGKMMLTTAVIMQLMGWAMIKKIVNIKV